MTGPGRDPWWVALLFMTACSGATSPGVDVPAAAPVLDAATRVAADMTPDAGPVKPPAPADAAPPPDASKPREWYCLQLRRTPDDADYLSMCSPRLFDCALWLEESIKEGWHTTRCTSQPQAACFQVWDKVEDYHFTICADSLDKCRQRAKDERPHTEDEVITACEIHR